MRISGTYNPSPQSMTAPSNDLFEVLGLSKDATDIEVNHAPLESYLPHRDISGPCNLRQGDEVN